MYGNNDIGDNTIVKEFVRSRVEAYSDAAHPEAANHVKNAFNYDGWGVMFQADDWKWYDSYPDIQFLEKLFDEFEELLIGDDRNNTSYALEFIRLGEETDDIEERMYGAIEGRLYVGRSIHIDGN
jgi:hypothetical protein